MRVGGQPRFFPDFPPERVDDALTRIDPTGQEPVHAGGIERLAKRQQLAARPAEDHAHFAEAAAGIVRVRKVVHAELDDAHRRRHVHERSQFLLYARRKVVKREVHPYYNTWRKCWSASITGAWASVWYSLIGLARNSQPAAIWVKTEHGSGY